MKRFLLLVTLVFLFINKGNATHMAGADLTYQHIGNGMYVITYTFYRDCIGVDAQLSIPIQISAPSCNLTMSATLLPVPGTGQLITMVCPGTITTCDGGTATGIQEWEYTDTVFLNAQCPDWTFGVAECCRNDAITTIVGAVNEEMYIESNLNNSIFENNSPIFTNVPIAFQCIGQNNYFNHGAIDIDGDSLVYSFINPTSAPNDPLTYMSGYSIANPITSVPGISIDPFTGDIFMHPTVASEISVIAVRIEEYRNGVLIGAVIRDIQIYVINCNNQLPTATGINGTNVFSYSACVGGPICFDIFTNDADVGDTVTATWNQGIQAASFTVDTSGTFPLIHFCWTPTLADVRPQPYFFTVTVHDNACPSNGVQSYAYYIYVADLQATVTSTDISCSGGHNGQINIATQPGYQHTISPGFITAPTATHLSAGSYTIDISNGLCTGTYYVQINEPSPLSLNLTSQNATCSGATASATALVTGGTGPYDYLWSTNPPSFSSTITNLDTGNYTVDITDSNNCTVSGMVTINQSPSFIATMSATPATCNATDGTAAVQVSGGSGNFSFDWQPNVSSGSTASNLAAGVYYVTVTDDSSGCVQNVWVIVNNTAGTNASISSFSNATCESGEDGTATVLAIGGVPPYEYLWSPGGQTTATVTNLSPGNYTVMVADYVGCPTFLTVSIGFDFPAPSTDLGPDTIMCIGDVLVLSADSGYTYIWNTSSTSQSINVTVSGSYSVLVTDANGCETFDEITVNYITCFRNHSSSRLINLSAIELYPNPTNTITQLRLTDFPETEVEIRVINSLGNIMWNRSSPIDGKLNYEIDMSDYSPGVYVIQVISEGIMQTRKVTKL